MRGPPGHRAPARPGGVTLTGAGAASGRRRRRPARPHPISSAPELFMAAALGVPGPLARSRLRKVTGPGALPTAAARICATAAAALPPPLSANGHRAPPRPRRRPAHARARSRTGPPGAGPGVRPPKCVRSCVRALRAVATTARRPWSSSALGVAAGCSGKWSPPLAGVGTTPRRGARGPSRVRAACCVRARSRLGAPS